MSNGIDFIRFRDGVVDWDNAGAAVLERLSRTRDTASRRRLEQGARRYRPSEDLVNAMNVAVASRSPLLLTGDPGTGKTQVAWFMKEYFGIELFEYQVRSESSARDLRYDFDAVAYLRDAYLASMATASAGNPTEPTQRLSDPRSAPRYLTPGPLWQAYESRQECVLLIDEIDKAPRDFPNDLLQELADNRFQHPFEPEFVECRGPVPLVVITSNGERRLPDPFLRRCIVHHIELDNELFAVILDAWDSEIRSLDAETRTAALNCFGAVRNRLHSSRMPSAAELIVWVIVLAAQGVTVDQLDPGKLAGLPALDCLVKDHDDRHKL